MAHGYNNQITIIVAGDWGVGKSSFIRRYIDGTFTGEPIINSEERTYGKILNIGGAEVKLSIKDIVGEDFRSNMTTAQYRSCQGVLLMFDLTEPNSFNNLEGWFRDADRYKASSMGGELDFILVGLKSDLVDERKVSAENAKAWADMFRLPFIETSSKNATNVNEAVQSVAERVHKRLAAPPSLNTSALAGGNSSSSVSGSATPKIVGMSSARGAAPVKKKKTCIIL